MTNEEKVTEIFKNTAKEVKKIKFDKIQELTDKFITENIKEVK